MMTEVAHWSGLLPAAWIAPRVIRAPRPSRAYVLVALGFAVSWVAEWHNLATGGSWIAARYFPIAQFGLFAAAFGGFTLAVLLPWVAVVQQVVAPGPDFLVTVVGSIGVAVLAWGHELRDSMFAYCVLGTALAVLMIASRGDRAAFDFWWTPYQGARLLAFALFMWASHREAARA